MSRFFRYGIFAVVANLQCASVAQANPLSFLDELGHLADARKKVRQIAIVLSEDFPAQTAESCMTGLEYLSRFPVDGAPAEFSSLTGGLAAIFSEVVEYHIEQGIVREALNGRGFLDYSNDDVLAELSKQQALVEFMKCTEPFVQGKYEMDLKRILQDN